MNRYIYDGVLLLSPSCLSNLRDLLVEDNFNNTYSLIKAIPITTVIWNHDKSNEKDSHEEIQMKLILINMYLRNKMHQYTFIHTSAYIPKSTVWFLWLTSLIH